MTNVAGVKNIFGKYTEEINQRCPVCLDSSGRVTRYALMKRGVLCRRGSRWNCQPAFTKDLLKEKGKVWSTILRREDTEGREKTLKAGRVEGGEPNEGRRGRS